MKELDNKCWNNYLNLRKLRNQILNNLEIISKMWLRLSQSCQEGTLYQNLIEILIMSVLESANMKRDYINKNQMNQKFLIFSLQNYLLKRQNQELILKLYRRKKIKKEMKFFSNLLLAKRLNLIDQVLRQSMLILLHSHRVRTYKRKLKNLINMKLPYLKMSQ